VQRRLMRLSLAAALAYVVLEPTHRGVEGIADRDVDVFVGVVLRPGTGHRQLLAGRVDLNPGAEQVALVTMAMLLLGTPRRVGIT
jgi:hypothetical protein